MKTKDFKALVLKENKTDYEYTLIITEYEKTRPVICGTKSLCEFLVWYDINNKQDGTD